ncbi:MAG TPA: hypothetical protein VF174_08810 [Micromonosporaceae bacterium]
MINRIDPALPAYAYKTYEITSPISTHFRDATCDEAGCLAQRNGWETRVDETTDLGQRQAHYIRQRSGRQFTERLDGVTVFTFPPGQRCFAGHKVPLERPEIYVVRGGDWRGNPFGDRQRLSADAWVNDFGEHQDRIARVVNG